eukprot:COSAG04_NODE_1306_length_7295_cov_3.324208_1_plen_86_part_10
MYVIRRSDAVAAGKHIAGEGASGSPEPKKKVAVVCTSWTPNSHAEVIVSKFLQGFPTGPLPPPTPHTHTSSFFKPCFLWGSDEGLL